MAAPKRTASFPSNKRSALGPLRKKPYLRPPKGARLNQRQPHTSSRDCSYGGLAVQDTHSTREEVPNHAKPVINPQRPIVPFQEVTIGQWYSAAVDIERQGKKTWGGVKHRILVTGKDEALSTLFCVYSTTFGGASPEEYTQKKESKGESTHARETWHYLPTPDTRHLVSIPTYDAVRSYPPVINGFVNFASMIQVRYSPGAKARELPRLIPETKPKFLRGPVRDPELVGQCEPVFSPDYTRLYIALLRSEFTELDRATGKGDWARKAAGVLQRLAVERDEELELWEEEWTGIENDEKMGQFEVTGSFEPNHEHDNDDDDEDDEDGRDSSSRDGASSYTDSYGAGDQNQRGDGRSDGEGMQRRRSERERYGDKKGAHGTAVTMRLYMLDPEDPARALPSGLQQLIDECCPRHEIPPP